MGRILINNYRIVSGDRIAICARNSPEWCIAYMAITMVGATVVPMNSWWKGSEINYGLSDSGSKMAIVDQARFNEIEPFINSLQLDIIIIKPEKSVPFPEFNAVIENVPPFNKYRSQ